MDPSPVDLLKKGSLSIMVFGSFFDQGIERLSERFKSQGVRVFVFFYIFSAFILTQGYKASMMSALTIPIVPKPLGEYSYFPPVPKCITIN